MTPRHVHAHALEVGGWTDDLAVVVMAAVLVIAVVALIRALLWPR